MALGVQLSSSPLPPLPCWMPTSRTRAGRRLHVAGMCTSPRMARRGPNRAASSPPPTEARRLTELYEGGYGSGSLKDYLDAVRQFAKPDGGPPRWFCPVECGRPIQDAPLLMFLPGIGGLGTGLFLHHKSLGKVFEVMCLHIPAYDRTPFEGLVRFVEHSVKYEYALSPNKPIYLIGDSFGGCLALAVAARNSNIDLILVLVNPATSFGKSQVQPLLPTLEAFHRKLHIALPYFLSFIIDIIPRETLIWKLNLLKSAAFYANSRLHAVEAEVLVLASGKDSVLPSGYEADRLRTSLKNCIVRYFKDSGHILLLEDGINLLRIIKATGMYRRSGQHDFVADYFPPPIAEIKKTLEQDNRWFKLATSPVMLSTLKNGTIVRGLAGVPNEGPVLLVGNHMLMGLEIGPLIEEFLREKEVIIRAMVHSFWFSKMSETSRQVFSSIDLLTLLGAVPVSASNMYRLFSRKSFVLLHPGVACEALHRKGEEYRLFWLDQPEFVRMAARFEATIVPFGVVGEDDIAELVLDYHGLTSIPSNRKWIEEFNQDVVRLRTSVDGEVSNQDLFIPRLLPKIPGRFYYLFGKAIATRGMKDALKDQKNANELYLQIKSEVESIMSYLKRKREEDPYRNIFQRTIYQTSWGFTPHVPTFEP